MVTERKTIQPEASSTFRNKYGFVTLTTRDFVRCPRCGYGIYPDSAAGRFDTIIGYPIEFGAMYWGAVEVKNGTSTSLAFNKVDDKQIIWYHSKQGIYDMWLWFSIGDRINHKQYPRRTFLIPFGLFLHLKDTLDRKSIPVGCEEIQEYELVWSGKGQWVIPDNHELWRNIKNFEIPTEEEGNEVVE